MQQADGQELSILTVRIPKEMRLSLWQMKIVRGVKIETFIQDAIEEKLGKENHPARVLVCAQQVGGQQVKQHRDQGQRRHVDRDPPPVHTGDSSGSPIVSSLQGLRER